MNKSDLEKGDASVLLQYLTPDCLYFNVPRPNRFKGHKEIEAALTGTFSRASFDCKTYHIATNGNVVFTERLEFMEHKNGKGKLTLPVIGVFEMAEDGKISVWKDYFNEETLRKSRE